MSRRMLREEEHWAGAIRRVACVPPRRFTGFPMSALRRPQMGGRISLPLIISMISSVFVGPDATSGAWAVTTETGLKAGRRLCLSALEDPTVAGRDPTFWLPWSKPHSEMLAPATRGCLPVPPGSRGPFGSDRSPEVFGRTVTVWAIVALTSVDAIDRLRPFFSRAGLPPCQDGAPRSTLADGLNSFRGLAFVIGVVIGRGARRFSSR